MAPLDEIPITLGPDGLYHAKVTVGSRADGSPDRRHRSGRTVEAVRAKLRILLREVDAGRKPRVGRVPTVEQWFTTWLTDIATVGARALAPTTLNGYWSACKTWIFPLIGGVRLDVLEPDHLDKIWLAMQRAERSPSSLAKVHAVLRRGLEIAVRRTPLGRNVAKMIDPPGYNESARESLTQAEVNVVLAAIANRRNGARWLVGLAIGPRQGETLGLRWECVDLDAGTVSIEWQLQRLTWRHGCADPHACGDRADVDKPSLHRPAVLACPGRGARHDRYHRRGCPKPRKGCPPRCTAHAANCRQRREGGLVIRRPKGWRRNPRPRVVALPARVIKALRAHRAAQTRERLAAGTAWTEHGLVFTQVDGQPIDPRHDYEEWQAVLSDAGLSPKRVHIIRHTTATALFELGEDIAVVQQVLGHQDIRTTRGYQDVRTEMTKRAAKRMDKMLAGKPVTDLVTERRRQRAK